MRGNWLGLLGQLRLRDTRPAQGPLTTAIDTDEAPVHLVRRDRAFPRNRSCSPGSRSIPLSGASRNTAIAGGEIPSG